jgi:PRTRC genetic system protein A
MYHLLRSPSSLDQLDYIVAGNGIYKVLDCFGIRVPMPLVSCEIRGLLPLGSSNNGMTEAVDFGPSYHILTDSTAPSLDPDRVYQYVIGREGVFLLAGCSALSVLMPISERCVLPGLVSITPTIHFSYPRVDERAVQTILQHCKMARDEAGNAIERLFYLIWESQQWLLCEPEQDAGHNHVRAKMLTPEHQAAVIEGHSHHRFAAYFSDTDNQAEVRDGGFRVYFVLGHIFSQPELRVRICVHGYQWEVPAAYFFEIPKGISDAVAKEWGWAA